VSAITDNMVSTAVKMYENGVSGETTMRRLLTTVFETLINEISTLKQRLELAEYDANRYKLQLETAEYDSSCYKTNYSNARLELDRMQNVCRNIEARIQEHDEILKKLKSGEKA